MNSAIEAEAKRPQAPAVRRHPLARWARRYALQIGTVGVAFVIWLVFVIAAPTTFLSFNIYNALLVTTPYFAMVAIPLTLVIIAAEIDLSFGSIMAWGMTGFDVVYLNTQNFWLGFVACLLFGLMAGLINGLIVVKVGVPSLVATIGTQFFWAGAVLVVTNAQGIGLTFLQGSILHEGLVGRVGGALPMQFIWMIIIAIIVWFLLNRTQFGAHVFLTGDNVDSARLMGVNVDRVKITCFALVGLAAAFAGFVQSVDLLFFWPTMGQGNFLNTLAAVFLGGTSVFGGTGTIFGTFVASFIINAINPGIVAAGLTQYYTQVIYGFIVVVSIALQALLRRRLS
ncbi:MAG: ABC transporter permease [Chloroflexi bacterium]|nr:ABC transporter permease [Chloroflexota bacterium]MCL5951401.1 ABC transporter permease [Chloroflexota bacterium]